MKISKTVIVITAIIFSACIIASCRTMPTDYAQLIDQKLEQFLTDNEYDEQVEDIARYYTEQTKAGILSADDKDFEVRQFSQRLLDIAKIMHATTKRHFVLREITGKSFGQDYKITLTGSELSSRCEQISFEAESESVRAEYYSDTHTFEEIGGKIYAQRMQGDKCGVIGVIVYNGEKISGYSAWYNVAEGLVSVDFSDGAEVSRNDVISYIKAGVMAKMPSGIEVINCMVSDLYTDVALGVEYPAGIATITVPTNLGEGFANGSIQVDGDVEFEYNGEKVRAATLLQGETVRVNTTEVGYLTVSIDGGETLGFAVVKVNDDQINNPSSSLSTVRVSPVYLFDTIRLDDWKEKSVWMIDLLKDYLLTKL